MASSDDGSYGEEKPFLSDPEAVVRRRQNVPSRKRTILPWALTAISWLITTYLLLSHTRLQVTFCPVDERADCPAYFPTDLEALKPAVFYETRRFEGELIYDQPANRLIRNLTGRETAYVGPPSKEIDDNWERLLHDEFPVLWEEEAKPYMPDLIPLRTDNQFHFEPDMFHSLHCLNAVRMAVDKEYYMQPGRALDPEKAIWPQEDWERIHIDHCLDQLRQSIMCFGDLSPVPLYSWAPVPLAIGKGADHTCRKWGPVRKWVDDRWTESRNKTETEKKKKIET